uniref:Uncharacterized protein n=1 Tax=Arundo donax TaxID=35708 RepID=A0A0A9A599_ARUDO
MLSIIQRQRINLFACKLHVFVPAPSDQETIFSLTCSEFLVWARDIPNFC